MIENGIQYGTGTMYRTTKFNLANVKDFETLCYNEKGDVMLVEMGIPEITKKNIEQVMARIFLYQCANRSSATYNKDIKCWEWISWEHIYQHRGLWTDAPKQTRVQFTKKLERTVIIRYGNKGRMEWRRLFE